MLVGTAHVFHDEAGHVVYEELPRLLVQVFHFVRLDALPSEHLSHDLLGVFGPEYLLNPFDLWTHFNIDWWLRLLHYNNGRPVLLNWRRVLRSIHSAFTDSYNDRRFLSFLDRL